MAADREQLRIVDFYTEVVLPALAQRLDQAFPEFGWRRDARGWVATNEEQTHARLGVRAERVVAHGPAPRGFLVHGGEPMLWTAYLAGGEPPRGAEFVRVVAELADRAGVDSAPLERETPRDRSAELVEEFFKLAQRELVSDHGDAARAYLEQRGFPLDGLEDSGLGLIPSFGLSRQELRQSGYSDDEMRSSGLFADRRWPGRLCGAWRTEWGRIGTFWARAVDDAEGAETRYLYLRGAVRTNLPPYGLQRAARDLVLVEGLLDHHQLRARGFENTAALGGTATNPRLFERLSRLGVHEVTLCFDADGAGRAATVRAVENATRAVASPSVFVVTPPAKDPDELIRERGVDAWQTLVNGRQCGIVWRAKELVKHVEEGTSLAERRTSLHEAGTWLGTLPPRLALEQEDAVTVLAERCGYSAEAARRAFQQKFFRDVSRTRNRLQAHVDRRAEADIEL